MSMEDPFFVVRGEVQKAVNTAQGLFQRWMDLLQDPSSSTREELDWTTNELRNNLRSIEWDLEDLDETINILLNLDFKYMFLNSFLCIVESNPRKFSLDPAELRQRKAFIGETRQCVKALLGEGNKNSWNHETDKYKGLDQELHNANSQFIEGQVTQQQLIMEQQDEELELVSGSIGVLKNMSQRIGSELDEQAVMLDDFSHELDTAQSRMDNVLKKLAKVSHMTSDRRQWCAIIILLSLLLVVLILFFTP
ncbi:hypothetical protein GDO86_007765 [Hymenochirus boettgeri]|uniref:t-SNARE coiled-coil homology domain-containing protein n=1 Tax=Hymenochirus boettgeri TaxID=247094 RepID=A0A8T2IYV3_9PIPI|nr:hypothetical protein GDO86_007765 [Hymenochirus boettgeri]